MAKPKYSFSDLVNMEIEAQARKPKFSLDDVNLFGSGAAVNNRAGAETKIAAEKLHPSSRNPFIVEHDEAMDELIASIKAKGILVPLIVRSAENGAYEVIAGHRRLFAAKEAGLTEAPCIVREMTDEEADIIMVDTNLNRPHIRTSEKAFAYKLKYEAIKRTWGGDRRSFENQKEPGSLCLEDCVENQKEPSSLCTEDGKSSAELIAKEMGVSDKTIKNYLRLTKLQPSLLELVDRKELPMKAGVQLSYLHQNTQKQIYILMNGKNIKVDPELAATLRKEFEGTAAATMEDILNVMHPQKEEKNPKKPKPSVKLDKAMKKEYFPEGYDDQAIEEVIRQLLEQWAKANKSTY